MNGVDIVVWFTLKETDYMKYLFINDIEFTLHKRKKIIFIFYLLITVSLWLRSFDFENFTTYLGTSLGMTLNLEKY